MPQIQANEITLEYESYGDENRETILLIMGLGGQLTLWPMELVDVLVKRGYRVVRFDNRDVGLSQKMETMKTPNILWMMLLNALRLRPKAPYLLDDMAQDAVALLDALQIDRAHIVGASMGGMIAQLIAAKHPTRALSLTSIMSTTGHRSLPKETRQARKALLATPPKNPTTEEIVGRGTVLWETIGSPGFQTDPAVRRAWLERDVQRCYYPGGVVRQLAAILASGDRRTLLGNVKVPTVVLHGEDDPLVPVEGGRDTAAHIEGAELITIAGMGHDFPLQLVERMADAICQAAGRAGSSPAVLRA